MCSQELLAEFPLSLRLLWVWKHRVFAPFVWVDISLWLFPGAGLSTCPPLYPQVTPGWDPAALCAILSGPWCTPCCLGPPHLLPHPQVNTLCLYTDMEKSLAGQCVGLCMELCWQQLPEASFWTFLLSTCQLPPVGLVGRVSSGPQDYIPGIGVHTSWVSKVVTKQLSPLSWALFLIISALCPTDLC